MIKEPLVSIIIPFYNRPNLLIEAIKNISLQTYQNIEVILVDDGSNVSLENIEDFSLNIQLKRLEKNKGPGCARRQGRLIAKGAYICYLDSDDWWSNDFIEECVKVLEREKSIGMAFTNTRVIKNGFQDNRRVKNYIPNQILPILFIYEKRFWSTSSCIWRNEVSLPEHWKDYRNHEDYIHDILSSRLNNTIKYVEKGLTFKNQSAPDRIPRESEEVRKALNEILKINGISNIRGLSYFYLNRIYKNKLKIRLKDLPRILNLPSREFKAFSNNWFLFYVLILFNILSVKHTFQKRNINKLKS